MSDNINFKDLWVKQTSVAPNPKELLPEIKKLKQSNLKKLVMANILLIATSAFIISIWIYFKPKLITTKIGIVLTILAMVIFLFTYNKSYTLFKSTSESKSNSDYLKELLAIKAKQKFMATHMLNLYFILLSIGLGLYMYEYTSKMKFVWALVTYGITLAWILFNWFYLRPKQIKKQNEHLEQIILKFEMITDHLQN